MQSVSGQASYCSDFANGVVNTVMENTTFKSHFAQKIQQLYQRKSCGPDNYTKYDKKTSRISKVETVIWLGGKDKSDNGKACEQMLKLLSVLESKLKSVEKEGFLSAWLEAHAGVLGDDKDSPAGTSDSDSGRWTGSGSGRVELNITDDDQDLEEDGNVREKTKQSNEYNTMIKQAHTHGKSSTADLKLQADSTMKHAAVRKEHKNNCERSNSVNTKTVVRVFRSRSSAMRVDSRGAVTVPVPFWQ